MKRFALFCLALGAGACQPLASGAPTMSASPAEGLAFAQASCGGCHAVMGGGASPHPEAPPFARVVNQDSLTANSLSSWLRDAHNYPAEMQFDLEGGNVDDLVAYMLTLRDPNYRPPI